MLSTPALAGQTADFRGMGFFSCKELPGFEKISTNEQRDNIIQQWVWGFASAMNVYLESHKISMRDLSWMKPDDVVPYIDTYCKKHQDKRVADAAMAMFFEMPVIEEDKK
jgi:hypothetical protein